MTYSAGIGYGVRIEEAGPEGARPVFTGRRDIPTSKVLTKSGLHVVCEHNVERDFVTVIDFDHRVRRIRSQPHTISFVWAGERIRYTPDFALETEDGEVIVEVKTRAEFRAKSRLQHRLQLVKKVYDHLGKRFIIAFDDVIRMEPRFSNIKELRRYRSLQVPLSDRQIILAHLHNVGSDTLLRCAGLVKDGPSTIRALAAQQYLILDLGLVIGDHTICCAADTRQEGSL
ncbi:TnsA endonuclease N-terminal domain-containing protein [Aerococcus mictus]|uniref:TnsA endonuclease N-terminal domain-containing protein n=1 Tax=Aerococcus mictus TaxID=2976810 RepID=UPI000DCE56BF|nr:TnsA endonuclease N-terminal domain-containing protein [Aerococcus mictus]RAV68812.1 hypothetical protein DBT47_09820 [Aerococcus mictus]